ncbi:MAG: hypothetical protein II832_01355 [Synergistaceae bacterium]|nr:hypothetical protein [Synergistaceae bacterium]
MKKGVRFMEQKTEEKKEYKGLEIEIIDYEYEDVITVSGLPTTLPKIPTSNTSSWF